MVTPDNIMGKSLEQVLGSSENAIDSFNKTADLVRAVLFSVFSEKRSYALKVLRVDWGYPNLEVGMIEADGNHT